MDENQSSKIADWLDTVPSRSIWTTATTVFEIRFGIECLPESSRRRKLQDEFENTLGVDLENRVLDFDEVAARSAGALAAWHRRSDSPVEIRDVQIAGIVASRNATLATRNIRHFEGVGLTLINPWARRATRRPPWH